MADIKKSLAKIYNVSEDQIKVIAIEKGSVKVLYDIIDK